MSTLNTLILLIIAAVTVFLVISAIGKMQSPKFTSVKIGNGTVNAEIADNVASQTRGLMFRESLPENGGMLFVFPYDFRHGIWMMNTTIPLDIIWIDANKTITDIRKNAEPCEALAICPVYSPSKNSRYVLEVNSGYADKHGIEIGNDAKFRLN